jgi:hypothetical protein
VSLFKGSVEIAPLTGPVEQHMKDYEHCTMPKRIDSFMGQYRFLSNFWPAHVSYDGVVYKTTEHAFQAAKSLDLAERAFVRDCETARAAKTAGRKVTLRPDWEQIKIGVMEDLVRQKFSVAPLRAMLLSTGDAELVEGNDWSDFFWGVCDGKGRNEMGKILMRIRAELRAK